MGNFNFILLSIIVFFSKYQQQSACILVVNPGEINQFYNSTVSNHQNLGLATVSDISLTANANSLDVPYVLQTLNLHEKLYISILQNFNNNSLELVRSKPGRICWKVSNQQSLEGVKITVIIAVIIIFVIYIDYVLHVPNSQIF